MNVVDIGEGVIRVNPSDNFSLYKTLTCGQCFRWKQLSPNTFLGITGNSSVCVSQAPDGTLYFLCSLDEVLNVWVPYFGLDENYDEYMRSITLDPHALKAYQASRGIHILRQDIWEMVVSYIVSQHNSLSNIGKVVDKMSEINGKRATNPDIGSNPYVFPSAQELDCMSTEDWDAFKLGFRRPYVVDCVSAVVRNGNFLEGLKTKSTQVIIIQLQLFKGIGPKVANCIALFGYHRLDSFPIDVWIQRVADSRYNGHIQTEQYGPYAGLVQQFLFNYARNI
ncbi:MAG: DNA glycosylase [Acinetobacter sp.]